MVNDRKFVAVFKRRCQRNKHKFLTFNVELYNAGLPIHDLSVNYDIYQSAYIHSKKYTVDASSF